MDNARKDGLLKDAREAVRQPHWSIDPSAMPEFRIGQKYGTGAHFPSQNGARAQKVPTMVFGPQFLLRRVSHAGMKHAPWPHSLRVPDFSKYLRCAADGLGSPG